MADNVRPAEPNLPAGLDFHHLDRAVAGKNDEVADSERSIRFGSLSASHDPRHFGVVLLACDCALVEHVFEVFNKCICVHILLRIFL